MDCGPTRITVPTPNMGGAIRKVSFIHRFTRVIHVNKTKTHITRKQKINYTLRIATAVVSTALCTWQLAICFQKHSDQPVGTNIRVETFNQYTLPGLTLCPATFSMAYNFSAQFEKHCEQNRACNALNSTDQHLFPFTNMNVTLLDLWQPETSLTIKAEARCYYAVNSTECESPHWMQQERVDTTAGPCRTFRTNLQWHYVGKPWVFWMTLIGITDARVHEFSVDLYASTLPDIIFLSRGYIVPNYLNDFITSVTKFEYLNTSRKRCNTEEEADQCSNKWIVENLQTPPIECRWPFINSSALPLCNTMFQVKKVESQIQQLGSSTQTSNYCRQPCVVTRYSLMRDSNPSLKPVNDTYISITIKSNTKQIVSEYFTYPLSSLVSDVGGSVGLFLGISLISSFNFACKILKQIHERLSTPAVH